MSLYDAKFFSSRLLGQNRFFTTAGAVLDIEVKGDNQTLAALYVNELERLLAALPIKDYQIKSLVYGGGINIAVKYPYDLLMVACEILDWVWEDIVDLTDREIPVNFARSVKRFKKIIKENQKVILRKIYAKAQTLKLNFFIYKDLLVLGSGKQQFRAPLNQITKLGDIPWKKIANIPTVLITGTNGKTTTTRLTEFICRKAGLFSGYCSTDWVMINGKSFGEGDLSGPTGHQMVLMHPQLDVAVLEVARGGLVKRGLLPNYVAAATVTNIAYDHIGQNGIETLMDLAEAKGVVYAALADDGIAIVNLDDEYIPQLEIATNKAYLSTKKNAAELTCYLLADNFIVYLEDNLIMIATANEVFTLNDIRKIPLTVDGLARYNYENVLHAVALTFALGIEPRAIQRGLRLFGGDAKSNFGRWNHYHSTQHGQLVVDIAHNPAGLISVLNLAQDYRRLHGLTGKFGLMYGVTADRRETLPEIAKIIADDNIDFVVIKEFQESLRGSELGEMPQLVYEALIAAGYPDAKIKIIPNELEAVQYILSQAQPADFWMLCTHDLLTDVSRLLRDTVSAEKKAAE